MTFMSSDRGIGQIFDPRTHAHGVSKRSFSILETYLSRASSLCRIRARQFPGQVNRGFAFGITGQGCDHYVHNKTVVVLHQGIPEVTGLHRQAAGLLLV